MSGGQTKYTLGQALQGGSTSQTTSKYSRGDVVWARDVFKDGEGTRPWLVLSNGDHPFDEQYVSAVITTNEREESIPITAMDWKNGHLHEKSYINPWAVVTLQERWIEARSGELREDVVAEAVEKLDVYTS